MFCLYPPQAHLDHTVHLVGRLCYIIGYYNDKNKAATWEQITVLGFPPVTACCVSVPRLLHCPSWSQCYWETCSFMVQWLTGHHKNNTVRQVDTVTKQGVSPPESGVESNRHCCCISVSAREGCSRQAKAGWSCL